VTLRAVRPPPSLSLFFFSDSLRLMDSHGRVWPGTVSPPRIAVHPRESRSPRFVTFPPLYSPLIGPHLDLAAPSSGSGVFFFFSFSLLRCFISSLMKPGPSLSWTGLKPRTRRRSIFFLVLFLLPPLTKTYVALFSCLVSLTIPSRAVFFPPPFPSH